MPLRVDLNIINQKGTPAFYSDTFANRPAAGFAGRVFISTDTGAIYEDTGSAWTLIADAGAGTTGTLEQVTTNGNTTTKGLVVTSGNVAIGTATAGAPLDIHCTGTAAQFNGTGTNNAYVIFQNAGASKWRVGNLYNAGANSFEFVDAARSTNVMSLRSTGTYQEVYVNGYNTISNIASFSSSGNYAINPSLTLSIPSTTTFNSGASWSGMATSLLNTWGANNTIDQGAVMSGFIGVNRQSFNTAGVSITVTQGSNGARAICGMQVLSQTGGSINGTISHGASLLVQGVYPSGSANVTYTNYYGLLLNQLDEFGTVTFTNRWGIYQGGASDKNYFNGNMLIKSTTDNGSALQVTGSATISSTLNVQGITNGDGTADTRIISRPNTAYAIGVQNTTSSNVYYLGVTSNAATANFQIFNTYSNASIFSMTYQGAATFSSSLTAGNGTFVGDTETLRLYTTSSTGYTSLKIMNDLVSTSRMFEIRYYGSSSGTGESAVLGTVGGAPISFNTTNTERLRITAGGNVLIGTTTDAGYKLQVSGQSYFQGNGTTPLTVLRDYSSGSVTFAGFYANGTGLVGSITYNGSITLYNSTSDYRLKEDLKDYNALNIISKLKTYDFKWKNTQSRDYGVIAHELQEVLPNYVSGNKDQNNMQQVDYSKIVPILIKSIQELNDKIEKLQNN